MTQATRNVRNLLVLLAGGAFGLLRSGGAHGEPLDQTARVRPLCAFVADRHFWKQWTQSFWERLLPFREMVEGFPSVVYRAGNDGPVLTLVYLDGEYDPSRPKDKRTRFVDPLQREFVAEALARLQTVATLRQPRQRLALMKRAANDEQLAESLETLERYAQALIQHAYEEPWEFIVRTLAAPLHDGAAYPHEVAALAAADGGYYGELVKELITQRRTETERILSRGATQAGPERPRAALLAAALNDFSHKVVEQFGRLGVVTSDAQFRALVDGWLQSAEDYRRNKPAGRPRDTIALVWGRRPEQDHEVVLDVKRTSRAMNATLTRDSAEAMSNKLEIAAYRHHYQSLAKSGELQLLDKRVGSGHARFDGWRKIGSADYSLGLMSDVELGELRETLEALDRGLGVWELIWLSREFGAPVYTVRHGPPHNLRDVAGYLIGYEVTGSVYLIGLYMFERGANGDAPFSIELLDHIFERRAAPVPLPGEPRDSFELSPQVVAERLDARDAEGQQAELVRRDQLEFTAGEPGIDRIYHVSFHDGSKKRLLGTLIVDLTAKGWFARDFLPVPRTGPEQLRRALIALEGDLKHPNEGDAESRISLVETLRARMLVRAAAPRR